jgi:hypothetical protein
MHLPLGFASLHKVIKRSAAAASAVGNRYDAKQLCSKQ